MNDSLTVEAASRLVLDAKTAAELMTPNPVSIRDNATVREAVAFLTDKGFSAAPVIDVAGRPVGVISRSDLLVHDRNTAERVPTGPDYYGRTDFIRTSGQTSVSAFQTGTADPARVCDVMTPAVFSVPPEAPAPRVVSDMVGLKVHRLFVVGSDGVLVGVISSLDVLRHLREEGTS